MNNQTTSETSSPQNLDEVFTFFESRTNLEKKMPLGNPNRVYRLDRMKALCNAFDNPQDSFRNIHLAGSKGKGSTAAYIAALLKSTGRKVGVYASPHLLDYRERFRIEGEDFPENRAFQTARNLLYKLPELENNLPGTGAATTFELLTLFAFLFFRDTGCDTAVLETGLGGRLDATNVISRPEAVVFTPIEKEHSEILGSRLRDIAGEKSGIMKSFPGALGFSSPQHHSAMVVIRKTAAETGVNLVEISSHLENISKFTGKLNVDSDFTNRFNWKLMWKDGNEDLICLNMGGGIQAENAALALMVVRKLEPDSLHKTDMFSSLAAVELPGRFQFLRQIPAVVLDGAHTPRSVSALAEAFLHVISRSKENKQESFPEPILLFGSVEGKDHKTMARKLCGGSKPFFKEVIISTPGFFKPSKPAEVAESFRRAGAEVAFIPDPEKAWESARAKAGDSRPILITGSFFMAGEIARLVKDSKTR